MGAIICVAYVNADLVFLLRNKSYFGIDTDKEVGVIQSKIVLASLIAAAILSFFMGQAYDIFGRIRLISINFLILAILVAIIPYTSPSIFWLGVTRVGLGISSHFLITNPLIPDYVKEQSRGRAVVL
jgi:MFS family permease